MRFWLILFLLSISFCKSTVKKNTQKCFSDSETKFFEKHYIPPYWNVNFNRPKSFWDVFLTEFTIGNHDDYQSFEKLGEGIAAQVYKGIHKETKELVVLKNMKQNPEKILKEIKVLQELKDAPNFLPLRDIYVADLRKGLTLVFDYFPHTSIQEILPLLTKKHIKYYAYELLRTLDFFHSRGIMHRDIKPLNVLLNAEKFEARIIDFGQGEFYLPGKEYTVRIGSLYYKAPELLLNYAAYDYSMDIWSVGVMVAEMMFQRFHFFATENVYNDQNQMTVAEIKTRQFRDQLDAIAQTMGTLPLLQYINKFKNFMTLDILEHVRKYKKVSFKSLVDKSNKHLVDNLGIDLLEKLIVYDHTKRLTAKEALKHSYFDEIRK